MRKAGCSPNTVDEVLNSPAKLRNYLTQVAVKKRSNVSDMNQDRVRDYVRAAKRKSQIEETDTLIESRKFTMWINKINAIGFEFCDEILLKS